MTKKGKTKHMTKKRKTTHETKSGKTTDMTERKTADKRQYDKEGKDNTREK